MAAYLQSCPECGHQLAPVTLDPSCPPWLCAGCRRAWWVAELSAEARQSWQPASRSHSWKALRSIVAARETEMAAALERGTSTLPEHLPLLSAAHLGRVEALLAKGAPFRALVASEIAARGSK